MDDRRWARQKRGMESDPTVTVFVIDDEAAIREALAGLLRSVGYAVQTFGSTADFLAKVSPEDPGCLILDVRLPGASGLDFQDDLAGRGMALPVILMTGHGDIPMSVRGMKAGAVDFLPKPFREQDMLDAVANALAADAAGRQDREKHADLRARWQLLSERERDVARRAVDGSLNKQIAFDLGLSEITVKIHRGNAMRKLEVTNLPDLVRAVEAMKDG